MENNGNTEFNFLALSIQPLAFASVAEIIGKFGGADQLRNAVNQLQPLLSKNVIFLGPLTLMGDPAFPFHHKS